MVCTVLKEYGLPWAINRSLYSIKLKMLNVVSGTEKIFEKKTAYPQRLNLFELDVDCLRRFIKSLVQDDKTKLIKQAEDACEGKIIGFSSVTLDYGMPINWQLNPITGRECSIRQKWYQIPDFDEKRGDIKVVWEISRLAHFILLARAYLLTENKKYYSAFSGQLGDWLKRNPYSYGANFKCGQECALRMINALLAYTVFEKCGQTTNEDRKNIKRLIVRCYRKIRSNFFYAQKCIKNNHTLSELAGMIVGAWCCEEEKQLAYAFSILDDTVGEQFTADGGYTQYSFNYTRLALQDLEVILAVEKKMAYRLNDRNRKKLQRAVELMYQCQSECGDMPNYGSNDGALVFPLTSCGYRDFRPVLNTVQALLTGERLYPAGRQDEELIWFGGDVPKDFSRKEKERNSAAFRQAGLYTLRKKNAWLMFILNDYRSRPAHMDQMHIDLWVHEVNVLCDCGTYAYASKQGKKFTSNASHNTVVYSGKPQMNAYGTFMIYDWTKYIWAKADMNACGGEIQSKNGYRHKRNIKSTETGFRITDNVKGKEGSTFEVRYHTPCEVEVKNDNEIKLIYHGETICFMKSDASFHTCRSVRSLYYLKAEEINCIVLSGLIQKGTGSIETEIIIKGEK